MGAKEGENRAECSGGDDDGDGVDAVHGNLAIAIPLSVKARANAGNPALMQWLKKAHHEAQGSVILRHFPKIILIDFYETAPRFVETIIQFNTTTT